MKTTLEQLVDYIKNAHTFTFLPEQLVKVIEEQYIPIEKANIRQAFDDGEMNVWNGKRDESFEFEGGIDYYNKTYKNEEVY